MVKEQDKFRNSKNHLKTSANKKLFKFENENMSDNWELLNFSKPYNLYTGARQ